MTPPAQLARRLRATDALIFDFDGTLAPNLDLPDMKRQVIALTLAAGVPAPVFADAFIVEIITLASGWLEQQQPGSSRNYHQEAHALITAIEMQSATATSVFDSTTQLLQRWRANGGRSAIVTRNCRAAILATFPEVLTQVDALLARDDVSHLKPDERHLQQAVRALNVSAERCMMIGDGAMDMQIGVACGMFNVGVLSGSSDRNSLRQAGADAVLDDISSFLPALDSL
ncbi:MAG: HAD family hydrolase [Pseudomonadales bacterium]